VNGAEKDSTTNRCQFEVRLNRARQGATTCSDADRQMGIERVECEISQVTPVKCKLVDKLFQHHERQLFQEVGTKATGPISKFAKQLALMKTAAGYKAYVAVKMTTNNRV